MSLHQRVRIPPFGTLRITFLKYTFVSADEAGTITVDPTGSTESLTMPTSTPTTGEMAVLADFGAQVVSSFCALWTHWLILHVMHKYLTSQ